MKNGKFCYQTDNLKLIHITTWNILGVIAGIVLLTAVVCSWFPDKNVEDYSEFNGLASMMYDDKCTDELLKEYVLELNFTYPDIVWAQACVESAQFTSPVYNKHRNLFGMKKSSSRITTAIHKKSTDYSHYSSWRESVIDRALYDCKYLSRLSRKEYLDYLGANYAEDPLYSQKIDSLSKKF